MAVLGRDWVIADFVTDIAELVMPALDMVKVIESLPSDINTITDLYKFLKSASGLIYDGMQVKGNAQAAANTLVINFKKQAFFIEYTTFTQVNSQAFFQTYLSPSGIAGLAGAKTISMLVMNGDGSQVALWDTGDDDSWIATNDTDIVHSRHGTIWQEDSSSGNVSWPSVLNHTHHQTLPYTGDGLRPYPNNPMAFLFLCIFIWLGAVRKCL